MIWIKKTVGNDRATCFVIHNNLLQIPFQKEVGQIQIYQQSRAQNHIVISPDHQKLYAEENETMNFPAAIEFHLSPSRFSFLSFLCVQLLFGSRLVLFSAMIQFSILIYVLRVLVIVVHGIF